MNLKTYFSNFLLKARSTKQWFIDNGIELLSWPSLSPDLNPIENLWRMLARRVYSNGRQFETAELERVVREQWDQIGMSDIMKLVDSMKDRVFKLILAGGEHTGY
jgi:hypothetical protein